MSLLFYPGTEESQTGSFQQRIEILMEAAERYKAAVLDPHVDAHTLNANYRAVPRDLQNAYNWDEISMLLREVRELPEGNKTDKDLKGQLLVKLAAVYEVLRGAKMSKLEAVRLALLNESSHLLGGSTSQIA